MDTKQDALGDSSVSTPSGASKTGDTLNTSPSPSCAEPVFRTASGFASAQTTPVNYSDGSGWLPHMTVEDQQDMSRRLAEKYGIPKPVDDETYQTEMSSDNETAD